MSIVLKGVADADGVVRSYGFACPGCGYSHVVQVAPDPQRPGAPMWGWNGSVETPTFTPSVLVRSMAGWTPEVEAEWDALLKQSTEAALSSRFGTRCHSFIADGVIDFLDDCTHALRGKHPLAPHPRVEQPEA